MDLMGYYQLDCNANDLSATPINGTLNNNCFKGAMDEVRIYNRVLLASAIKHLLEN